MHVRSEGGATDIFEPTLEIRELIAIGVARSAFQGIAIRRVLLAGNSATQHLGFEHGCSFKSSHQIGIRSASQAGGFERDVGGNRDWLYVYGAVVVCRGMYAGIQCLLVDCNCRCVDRFFLFLGPDGPDVNS